MTYPGSGPLPRAARKDGQKRVQVYISTATRDPAPEERRQAELNVSGMHRGSCSRDPERALMVNLAAGTCTIVYNLSPVTITGIRAAAGEVSKDAEARMRKKAFAGNIKYLTCTTVNLLSCRRRSGRQN